MIAPPIAAAAPIPTKMAITQFPACLRGVTLASKKRLRISNAIERYLSSPLSDNKGKRSLGIRTLEIVIIAAYPAETPMKIWAARRKRGLSPRM